MYVLYHLPVRGKFLRPSIRKVDVIEIISDQMKKEVFLNINQLIWTTLHRLVRGTSYLFSVGLTHVHSVLLSSDRNETEVLRFPFLLDILWQISI